AQDSAALRKELLWMQYEREAQAAADQGNYDEAATKLKAAVEQAESFGENDPRLSATIEGLASIYHEQGKEAEATELEDRIAKIQEQHPEREANREATDLDQLVELTLSLVPKKLQKEDWASYEKLTTKLSHLAQLCITQKEYGKAEVLFKKELEIERT